MNSRIRTPFYILFLNPDYVAARSLRSLRSKNYIFESSPPRNQIVLSVQLKFCHMGCYKLCFLIEVLKAPSFNQLDCSAAYIRFYFVECCVLFVFYRYHVPNPWGSLSVNKNFLIIEKIVFLLESHK